MITTITIGYKFFAKGLNWEAHHKEGRLRKWSQIVYWMYEITRQKTDLSYDELLELLRLEYKIKKVHSRCEISEDSNRIKIITNSYVFPEIYIQKT